jgi:hypothetical protein
MVDPKKQIPWNKGIKYTEAQKNKMDLSGLKLGQGLFKGKKLSLKWRMNIKKALSNPEVRRKIGESNSGANNGNWNINVPYRGLHLWVRRNLQNKFCRKCKTKKNIDVHNKDGKYTRNLSDWEWLCRKHHMMEDGRLEKFIKLTKNYNGK